MIKTPSHSSKRVPNSFGCDLSNSEVSWLETKSFNFELGTLHYSIFRPPTKEISVKIEDSKYKFIVTCVNEFVLAILESDRNLSRRRSKNGVMILKNSVTLGRWNLLMNCMVCQLDTQNGALDTIICIPLRFFWFGIQIWLKQQYQACGSKHLTASLQALQQGNQEDRTPRAPCSPHVGPA